jgi:RNA polymerase sigma-70 factor (ECF subfamily)
MDENRKDRQEIIAIQKLQDNDTPKEEKDRIFSWLVDKYKNKLFRFIFNYIQPYGIKEDAEEILLEVFTRFYKNIKSFKFQSSVETYLFRIGVNLSINFVKSKKLSFVSIDETNDIEDNEQTLEKIIELENNENFKKIILELLLKLPDNQRLALHLANYEQLSYKEIAEVMNTTVSAVESLLFRAKQNLKKYILEDKKLKEIFGL